MAITARGMIARYQVSVGSVLFLTLPLGYVLLKQFSIPEAALAALIVTSIGCGILRIYWAKRLLSLAPLYWVTRVFLRVAFVSTISAAFTWLPQHYLQPSIFRLALSIVVSISSTTLLCWFIGLTIHERAYLSVYIRDIVNRCSQVSKKSK